MQRFKKEMAKAEFKSPHYRYLAGMAGKGEKFVYGANGTLCQFARWRIEQVKDLHNAGWNRRNGSRVIARNLWRKAHSARNLATLPLSLMEFRL